MPASTYVPLSSVTLSTAQSQVTFSNIPQTYTDLIIQASIRTDRASVINDNIAITFNSDSSALYSGTFILGDGASASSGRVSAATNFNSGVAVAAGATANTFASFEIYIPSYTASQSKPVSTFPASENGATTAYIKPYAGLYRSNTAISTIALAPIVGPNFVAGSSFYLYGIKNS